MTDSTPRPEPHPVFTAITDAHRVAVRTLHHAVKSGDAANGDVMVTGLDSGIVADLKSLAIIVRVSGRGKLAKYRLAWLPTATHPARHDYRQADLEAWRETLLSREEAAADVILNELRDAIRHKKFLDPWAQTFIAELEALVLKGGMPTTGQRRLLDRVRRDGKRGLFGKVA